MGQDRPQTARAGTSLPARPLTHALGINMDRATKDLFLAELDVGLAALGYKRAKNSQEWKKKAGESDIEWIHLNAGLTMINPSCGVTYKDLEKVLPKESGLVNHVSMMLSSITGEFYDENTNPRYLAKGIADSVPSALENLKNRDWVIGRLQSDEVSSWPVASLSHRIRLLPLLLGERGLSEKAIQCAKEFEERYSSQDQFIPNYTVFINYLVEHYA